MMIMTMMMIMLVKDANGLPPPSDTLDQTFRSSVASKSEPLKSQNEVPGRAVSDSPPPHTSGSLVQTWTPPRHAKTPQDVPKTHHNCLKILQDTLKTAKESHKLAGAPQHNPKSPKTAFRFPKTC